jgi:LacI family transcriptional regulator
MKKSLHVMLGISAETEFGRGVIQGVIRFSATTPWILSQIPPTADGLFDLKTSKWKDSEPAGAIAAVESPEQLKFIKNLNVPCVSISSAVEENDLPTVACDDRMIGGLAASHFLERRLRHFAFVGLPNRTDSQARYAGFKERLAIDGFTDIASYEATQSFDSNAFAGLARWLDSLSKAVGVFAMDDALGRWVIDACRVQGIKVPASVAVLGCGNDPVLCGLATPALSSVALPGERLGFDAADMLSKLLTKKRPTEKKVLLPVSSVIPHGSTDNVSVRDPDVAAALRFILAHAGEWIGVRELLLALPVQRRSLERKFRRVLGRSPLEEIRRIRVDLAKQFLSGTDLTMPIVARRSGFSEAKQLSQVFRSLVGMTPTAYRAQFRLPEETPVDSSQSDGSGG